ncbi:bifunctional DNA primase/polymerase [Nocardia sp. NPDC004068]|uniref:bifunctional DNA primase/polymerase n=1 Tax=Nocardia sp. NPDC004068 TaxID=3364303 RepID=UPI0036CC0F6F
MNDNPFRRAAFLAADRGWFVFPLRAGQKTPAPLRERAADGTLLTWPQYATTDPHTIQRWWSGDRRYNIAIATGPSNLHIIDIDSAQADDPLGHLAPPHTPLPQTFTVRTPHGRHLYFHATADTTLRSTIGRLAPHIDSRGIGGYIVAAGSTTPHGTYRIIDHSPVAPLPDWLHDRLIPPPPQHLDAVAPPAVPDAYLAAIITSEAARVAAAEHHFRNATLFRAAFRLGRLVAAGELDETLARTTLTDAALKHVGHHDFTRAELDRTLTNGLTYGAQHPRHLRAGASLPRSLTQGGPR